MLRDKGDQPHPLAFDLLEGAARVVELFEATLKSVVADLSLAERDRAEFTAALHWANEVHAHGIHPEVVLRVLPLVRPEVLHHTTLFLRGPWLPLRRLGETEAARLHKWPGVVKTDGRGELEDVRAIADGPIETFQPRSTLDLARPSLLPRACGAEPTQLPDGRWLVVVAMGAQLDDGLRHELVQAVPNFLHPSVVLEARDEQVMPRWEWSDARRVAQVYVTTGALGHEFLEAVVQEIPIIVVDPHTTASVLAQPFPDDVAVLAGPEVVDRVISCLRSWSGFWAVGRAAPVDLRSRTAFTAAHLEAAGNSSLLGRGPWPS